jgi:hypothetical protein
MAAKVFIARIKIEGGAEGHKLFERTSAGIRGIANHGQGLSACRHFLNYTCYHRI